MASSFAEHDANGFVLPSRCVQRPAPRLMMNSSVAFFPVMLLTFALATADPVSTLSRASRELVLGDMLFRESDILPDGDSGGDHVWTQSVPRTVEVDI